MFCSVGLQLVALNGVIGKGPSALRRLHRARKIAQACCHVMSSALWHGHKRPTRWDLETEMNCMAPWDSSSRQLPFARLIISKHQEAWRGGNRRLEPPRLCKLSVVYMCLSKKWETQKCVFPLISLFACFQQSWKWAATRLFKRTVFRRSGHESRHLLLGQARPCLWSLF